jgi:hypothetical protein
VLFGKRLDELNITVDLGVIADDGNTTDLGYSPLLGSIGGNPDSDTLLDFMLREGSVVSIDHKDNTMVWHAEKAEQWLSNIHSGASRLQPLALAVWSNYSKSTKVTGPFKEILRVYPHRISRLLFILIRLIRPIEILYHLKHRRVQVQEELERVATIYKASLWASYGTAFTAADMGDNLAACLMSDDKDGEPPFPFRFGV